MRNNGVYQDQASIAPVGPSGSATIPDSVSRLFLAGEHYTVKALLPDGTGRVIQNSPAAWFGSC